MNPEEIIFEATKRLGFIVDGFDFSRKLHRAHEELEVLQAYFLRELQAVKGALWEIRDVEEFVEKALAQIELAQKYLNYFNFHDAHFHANSAHSFLSMVSSEIHLGPEADKVRQTTLWSGLTYGFGLAFLLYLAVFAVTALVFFL